MIYSELDHIVHGRFHKIGRFPDVISVGIRKPPEHPASSIFRQTIIRCGNKIIAVR